MKVKVALLLFLVISVVVVVGMRAHGSSPAKPVARCCYAYDDWTGQVPMSRCQHPPAHNGQLVLGKVIGYFVASCTATTPDGPTG